MQTLGNTENILSFPFYSELDENGEDDRTYFDKDWRTYFLSFIRNGVYYDPDTSLQVVSNSGFVLTLKAGKCFIEGAIYEDKKDFNFSIEKPDLILGRKDIVIARKNNTERRVKVIYVPGKAAGVPLVPDLIRNDDIYDIKLCDINVKANASSVSQADISDTRLDNRVCGKVTHVFDQVDTTAIFNDYQIVLDEAKTKIDTELKNIASLASSITAKVFTTDEFDIFLSGTKKIYTEKTKLKVVEEKRIVATNELVATRTTEFHKPSKGFSTETTVTKKFKFMQPNGDVIQTTDSTQKIKINLETGEYEAI